ncbi:hypothetical protein [Streptomyces sp. NPDC059668]|uniref:hypothetical protein n=1 Tax=Streptomyces sp. NPDC059668 TaxID=3346900 RepID=UPI0036C8C87C
MQVAPRTARRVNGGRRPTGRAVLVTVLLALFTTFGVGAPPAERADPVRSGGTSAGLQADAHAAGHGVDTDPSGHRPDADASGHRPGAVPRAQEECAGVCSTCAGGRHALKGERPTPPTHLATTAGATAGPSATLVRTPPLPEPAPHSPGPGVDDRGRAPPAPSGI